MNIIPIKAPFWVKWLFPHYIWDFDTKEHVLYLTFDDGPTPIITDWTLDLLKQYNAKATFFCIGNNIERHPEIFNRLKEEGHGIGNHTYNHPSGWKTRSDSYLSEVIKTQSCIENDAVMGPKLFRPPYGQITNSQGKALRDLGYRIIMWDVLAFDWMDTISKETCYRNVITKATKGSIIVFHDSVKASKNMQYALPKVLKYFSEKGFEFRRIPE